MNLYQFFTEQKCVLLHSNKLTSRKRLKRQNMNWYLLTLPQLNLWSFELFAVIFNFDTFHNGTRAGHFSRFSDSWFLDSLIFPMPGIATSRKSSLLNFSLGIMSPISEQPVSTKSPEQIRKIKLSKSIYFNIPTISNLYVFVTYIIYIYSPLPPPHLCLRSSQGLSGACRLEKRASTLWWLPCKQTFSCISPQIPTFTHNFNSFSRISPSAIPFNWEMFKKHNCHVSKEENNNLTKLLLILHGNYTEVFEISKFNARFIDVGGQMDFCLWIQRTSFHFLRFRSFSTARCHILRKRLNSLHFVIKWPLSIIFIRCYRRILRCNNQVINWLYD